MTDLERAADALSRAERHALIVALAEARDAAAADGRAGMAAWWSAVLCEVGAAADRDRATWDGIEDAFYGG